MYPHELIGKKAIRMRPAMPDDPKRIDFNYMTCPVIILAANGECIKYAHTWRDACHGDIEVMDNHFVDDNWTDYERYLLSVAPSDKGGICL